MKRNILLNPGPTTTTDSVKQALCIPDIAPREQEFCEVMSRVRKQLVQIVQGDETHVAVPFLASGTGAVEACLTSCLHPGERFLIHSNGIYGKRMVDTVRSYYGVDAVVIYEQAFGEYPDLQKVEDFLGRERTIRFFGFVHHETTTGILNPAEEFLGIARRYNVRTVMDAISSFGGIPIDLRKHPYDFVVSSSSKCVQAMAGISFVICDKKTIRQLADIYSRHHYLDLFQQYDVFEKTGQMQHTPPVQLFYALEQALKELLSETVEGRYARYQACWKVLMRGLHELHLEPLIEEKYQSRLVTSVLEPVLPRFSFREMHDVLYSKGFTIHPGFTTKSTFRIANIGALTPNDLEAFVKELGVYLEGLHSRRSA